MKNCIPFNVAAILLVWTTAVSAQTVHPAGAATTTINWQPASNTDLLHLDLDGDNVPDITFNEDNTFPTGAGAPTLYYFTASTISAGTELALDSVEFDSSHRFIAGDAIGRGLRWAELGRGILAYTLIGNGGTGGRGFFRNGQTGYIVVRKRLNGSWRYWWFNITGRINSTNSRVNFYGQAATPLASTEASSAQSAASVFPNPTRAAWYLQGTGSYQLFDSQGRLAAAGTVSSGSNIGCASLPAGIYFLKFKPRTGDALHFKLVRE